MNQPAAPTKPVFGRDQVMSTQATLVLADAENTTPDQLEAAIHAQGDLVEFHHAGVGVRAHAEFPRAVGP